VSCPSLSSASAAIRSPTPRTSAAPTPSGPAIVDSGGRLIGIATRRDLIKVFLRQDADIEQHVRDTIRADVHHLNVTVADGVVTLSGTLPERSQAVADLPVWGGA
jgi:CBS domain-containing protein